MRTEPRANPPSPRLGPVKLGQKRAMLLRGRPSERITFAARQVGAAARNVTP